MKKLRFVNHLAELILRGEKTVTWRFFDDKNLQVGDELVLGNSDTGQEFAKAEIVEVKEKRLGEVTEKDYIGHEKYKDQDEMLDTYKGYYGDRITLDSVVKIIKFKLI